MTRPSIILFMADQLRADHLGCYGNPVVRTPNIDAIARRGSRFERFHAASTVCMPNRATMMTGRMPSLHGVRRNGIPLSLAEATFPERLREAGYRTALIGKAHFQHYGMFAGKPAEPPLEAHRYPGWPQAYENELLTRWQDPAHRVASPYYGFEHTELCLYHGDVVEGDYLRWLEREDPGIARLRGREHALPDPRYQCRDAWRTRVPAELHPSMYIARRTADWLAAHRREYGDEPFFLLCSFPDPHHPFCPPGAYWDMYDPADIPLPASFHRRSRSPTIDYIHEVSRGGRPLSNSHHPFAPSEEEARQAIALTYGSISHLDHAIGVVLDTLRETGLDGSTIAAFTSDHGDFMGDHGVMLKGPMHFRGLTQVPFIWADPRIAQPPATVAETCGTLDIARTILDAATCPAFNGIQGRSLLPVLAGTAAPGNGVLIENETANLTFGRPRSYKLRSLVIDDWRITFSSDPALCELYDLCGDPQEVDNLWQVPAMHERRHELLQQLTLAMLEHADESPVPLASG